MEVADNLKWQWPDELDALKAAPHHHKLLFENDHVRVIDAFISTGETTEVHTHRWPASLYVISWSAFIRYDAHGNEIFNSGDITATVQSRTALWSEPLAPHALKNTGTDALHIISVEIKK